MSDAAGFAVVTTLFLVLALADGACSGFRAAQGRTALVEHRATDLAAARRGAGLVALTLAPALALAASAAGTGVAEVVTAETAALLVIGPYALAAASALVAYGIAPWRWKYLAMAVVLGPLTFARPFVIGGAGVLAVASSPTPAVGAGVVLAAAGVLVVEPLLGRRYASAATRSAGAPAGR